MQKLLLHMHEDSVQIYIRQPLKHTHVEERRRSARSPALLLLRTEAWKERGYVDATRAVAIAEQFHGGDIEYSDAASHVTTSLQSEEEKQDGHEDVIGTRAPTASP